MYFTYIKIIRFYDIYNMPHIEFFFDSVNSKQCQQILIKRRKNIIRDQAGNKNKWNKIHHIMVIETA